MYGCVQLGLAILCVYVRLGSIYGKYTAMTTGLIAPLWRSSVPFLRYLRPAALMQSCVGLPHQRGVLWSHKTAGGGVFPQQGGRPLGSGRQLPPPPPPPPTVGQRPLGGGSGRGSGGASGGPPGRAVPGGGGGRAPPNGGARAKKVALRPNAPSLCTIGRLRRASAPWASTFDNELLAGPFWGGGGGVLGPVESPPPPPPVWFPQFVA